MRELWSKVPTFNKHEEFLGVGEIGHTLELILEAFFKAIQYRYSD